MERSSALRPSWRHMPFVYSPLQTAAVMLWAWWRRRHTAKLLAELSAEQILDCGIESPELNVPTIEVPKGLMQRLMSNY
jgi:uncharacterized protein YjiS (DUF1127 family)